MIWLYTVLGSTALAPVDSDYLKMVAEDNIAELALVKMVARRSRDSEVVRDCKVMIQDHTKQLLQVQRLGATFAVDLPREPSAKHKAMFGELEKLWGSKLDQKFAGAQLQDHIQDVNDAQDEAEIGQNARLRRFARSIMPVFAKHETIWRRASRHLHVLATYGRPSSEEILRGKKKD